MTEPYNVKKLHQDNITVWQLDIRLILGHKVDYDLMAGNVIDLLSCGMFRSL